MGSSSRDELHAGELQEIGPVALGALAEILEFGLPAQQTVLQLGLLGGQAVALGRQRRDLRG